MDNKTKEILQKFSTQKVDLNMVKSVENNSNKANSLFEQGVKIMFDARGKMDDAINIMKKSLKLAEDALEEGKQLEKLADNIGADLKGSTEKAIQDAFNTISVSKQSLKDLNKAKNIII
jgi:hypothetical protein